MGLKFYLPNGQVHLKFYLPQHKIYLLGAGGQCLMLSPVLLVSLFTCDLEPDLLVGEGFASEGATSGLVEHHLELDGVRAQVLHVL